MDNSATKRDWGWIKSQAPELSAVIAQLRKDVGSQWVDECWTNGVVQRKPAWFFCKVGPVAVGTLWPELFDLSLAYDQAHAGQMAWGQPVVCVRKPGNELTAWHSPAFYLRGWQHGA